MAQVNNFHRMLEEARVQLFHVFPNHLSLGEKISYFECSSYFHHWCMIFKGIFNKDYQDFGFCSFAGCWLFSFHGPGAKENPRSSLHCLGTRLEKNWIDIRIHFQWWYPLHFCPCTRTAHVRCRSPFFDASVERGRGEFSLNSRMNFLASASRFSYPWQPQAVRWNIDFSVLILR